MTVASPTLDVALVPERSYIRIVPAGEMDMSNADVLGSTLAELRSSGWDDVVIDLRRLTFIDSSAIHLLLQAHRHAEATGTRLSFIDGQAPVSSVLALAGMHRVLVPAEPARAR